MRLLPPPALAKAGREGSCSSSVAAEELGPASWLFIERLCVSKLALTLTVGTHKLVPIHVGTHRTPLSFAPLALCSLSGSRASLIKLVAAHYASEALTHSAALIGSLQLLGNPTWLLRSVAAGLSDALSLPLRGLSEGPRQFVYGLGAGASSLLLHLSHGALTSVAGFTAALAANMGAEPIAARRVIQQPVTAAAPAALLQSRARVSRSGWGSSAEASRQESYQSSGTMTRVLLGAGHGLLGAVRRPVGGALLLVSEVSQSLIQSVSTTSFSPAPLPQGSSSADNVVPSAVMLQRKVSNPVETSKTPFLRIYL